uniref:Uncharacterized protein n=1 Tax=Salix viminalis TaxID=40686 RepID=A0A6N2MWJ0_SALVM
MAGLICAIPMGFLFQDSAGRVRERRAFAAVQYSSSAQSLSMRSSSLSPLKMKLNCFDET